MFQIFRKAMFQILKTLFQDSRSSEKTIFQIFREDHIPDLQRRPFSRSSEKTLSRSSKKTMFQIFRDDHVPSVQTVLALKALSF